MLFLIAHAMGKGSGDMRLVHWLVILLASFLSPSHQDIPPADTYRVVTAIQVSVLRDGKLYGPGVLDMKGGLVIALYALKALAAAGGCDRPVRVIFLGDEETGHAGSMAAERIRELARGAVAALNFETSDPEGGIVVGRKGSCTLKLEVIGVAAHAGRCP